MADKDIKATVTPLKPATAVPAQASEDRAKVSKALRPLYAEIARLSSTLGIARQACYEGAPGKAAEALELLEMQMPPARKLASLLVPASTIE